MIVRLHSQYEAVGETATLYLSGSLRQGEEDILYRMVAALPSHIRVVRLDLNALEQLDEDLIGAVRWVLNRCRIHRGGAYHLVAWSACPAPIVKPASRDAVAEFAN